MKGSYTGSPFLFGSITHHASRPFCSKTKDPARLSGVSVDGQSRTCTSPDSPKEIVVSETGGSRNGSKPTEFGGRAGVAVSVDPELAAVVAGWADVPPAVRAGIVAMVKAATAGGGQ